MSPDQKYRRSGKFLFALLMIASALFLGYTIFSDLESIARDGDFYRELGVNLRVHGVYGFGDRPTAYRPPLYPILLAAASYVTGLLPDSADVTNLSERLPNTAPAILNFLFAVLTVALTYRIGRRIGLNPWFATLAGLLVLVYQSRLREVHLSATEITATFLMVMVIDRLLALEQTKRYRQLKIFMLGLLFGIAALCRPTFLAFGLLCFPFLILLEWLRNRSFYALLSGFLLLVGISCFIIPWGLRNQRHFGRFIPTTTHGGITLFMVNNDPYYNGQTSYVDSILRKVHLSHKDGDAGQRGQDTNDIVIRIFERVQIPSNPNVSSLWQQLKNDPYIMWKGHYCTNSPKQELMLDDAYYAEAKKTIASRKVDFIKVSLKRAVNFWYPTIDVLSFNFYLYLTEFLLMLCGILFLARKGLPSLKGDLSKHAPLATGIWFILAILSIQLPHLFYNTEVRMRAPLLPVIVLLAVYGLCSLVRVYRKRRRLTEKKPEV